MISLSITTPDEAAALLDIYSIYIEKTVSFEYPAPDVKTYRAHIEEVQKFYPFLTVRVDGKIAGFAYACAFRERSLYDRSVETTVYLAPGYTGKGLGKRLYQALFEILKEQGMVMAYSCIVYPYKVSTGFHEKMGYRECGLYKNCAYKDGKWLNVIMMEKEIVPILPDKLYRQPISIHKLEPEFIQSVLKRYSD